MFYNKRTQSMSELSYYLVIATNGKTPCLTEKHASVLKQHFNKVSKSFGIKLITWEWYDSYLEMSFTIDKAKSSVLDFIMVFKSTSSFTIKKYYPDLVVSELSNTSFWNQGYFLKTLGQLEQNNDQKHWLKNLK
ncbi:IS200/IS605 family transposase [Staphylococcus caprae]|uniref:IS200/IS605 family transposase n=1 Tax=Staphylococcus caprae TaxID=29380 RepID=UPI000CD233A1|nr:IS200/IS605 family transposase [Staphylococcus caprae]POA06065.1 transposase [Staphylococcus caprae]SUL89872.1 Transposase IS200 like [Staphylococcus caprae]